MCAGVCCVTYWTRAAVVLNGWRMGRRGDRGEGGQHLLLDCDGLHGHLLGLGHTGKTNYAAWTPETWARDEGLAQSVTDPF